MLGNMQNNIVLHNNDQKETEKELWNYDEYKYILVPEIL